MGLLDEILGQIAGGQSRNAPQPQSGGSSRILMALLPIVLGLLASRGRAGASEAASGGGGLGDILGGALGGGGAQSGGGLADILGQVLGGGPTRFGPAAGAGGLGDLRGQVLGGGAGAPPAGAAGGLAGLGGLGALLEQLQRAGLGQQASSWVGTGENMPVSPSDVGHVFGDGGLEAIARQAGLSREETAEGLSALLPEVVDRMTPSGQLPDLDSLSASVDDLARRLGVQ